MDKQFMENKGFKEWYKDLGNNTYYIMGSDDIDYLASMYVLNKLFGLETTLFDDFTNLYHREDINVNDIKLGQVVGVDLDLSDKNYDYKCFGNHVTYFQNPNSINLNRNIQYGCTNYYNKFAGSVLLTIMSLYDIPLCWFTEEQLELLLCVDTGFKQWYFNKERFRYYYGEVLGYPEFIDIVSKHNDMQYFYDIINKYKLYQKIHINKDGYMETKMKLDEINDIFGINDLKLPEGKFIKFLTMQSRGMNLNSFKRTVNKDKIFSSAVTNKDFVKATIKY